MSRVDFLEDGNIWDNADMVLFQRTGGFNQTGQTSAGQMTADRFGVVAIGSYQYNYQQSQAQRPTPLSGVGLNYPLRAVYALGAENTHTPSGSERFGIGQFFEAQRVEWATYGIMKLGFLINTNKVGTYTFGIFNSQSASEIKWHQGFTVEQANTWQRVEFEVDFREMQALGGTVNPDNTSGLSMFLYLSGGPDITGVDPEGQWVNNSPIGGTNARMAAGQVNFFDSASNAINLTGFRSMRLEYAGQEVDLWAQRPRTLEEELPRCGRYYETNYPTGVAPGTGGMQNQLEIHVTEMNVGSAVAAGIPFKYRKRGNPIIALYRPSTGTIGQVDDVAENARAVSVAAGNEWCISYFITTTAPAGSGYEVMFGAGCDYL